MGSQVSILTWNLKKRWYYLVAIVLSLMALLLGVNIVIANVGIGGYISEKLYDQLTMTPSSFLFGSPLSSSKIVIGMSANILTDDVVDARLTDTTHATLRGTINSLNGLPFVNVWFEWGYDASCPNVVAPSTMATTGDYTFDLSGFNLGEEVYYRFVACGDGTERGVTKQLIYTAPSGGSAIGYRIMNWIIPFILMLAMLYVLSTDADIKIKVAGIIGLALCYAVAKAILFVLWGSP